jgi:hypothetical protein
MPLLVAGDEWRQGIIDLRRGLENGARSMISIAVATGVAGIIIGTVSLTGAHQFIGEFVEAVSAGNLVVMLLLVAFMSLILGMGLPTTANYIVVSSLMAPVIVMVGAQNGLIVPLVAVHLFVFYFGILADDTPPVGLAAFAAAAISKGDPIRTGVQGFSYDIRTAILPFMFIFNTDILLIDVGFIDGVIVLVTVVLAMLAFCSAIQHYMLVRNRLWETAMLLLIAFTLFRPDFWLDRVQPPYQSVAGVQIIDLLDDPDGALAADKDVSVRVAFSGPDFDDYDRIIQRNSILHFMPSGDGAVLSAADRLDKVGLTLVFEDGVAYVEEPFPGTALFQEMQTFDFYADTRVTLETVYLDTPDRMSRHIFYLPAIAMLMLIIMLQYRRRARLVMSSA